MVDSEHPPSVPVLGLENWHTTLRPFPFSVLPVRAPEAASGQPNKKALDTSQNLENKGPEIFPPPRSMVLKVVRGKILETLELSRGSTVFVFTRDRRASERLSVVKDR